MFLKVNRLKRRLSEWAPPSYLIINSLYKYLNSSKDYSHESNLLNRLKKIISKYEGFRNSIVQSNLGLVYSVANKFRYLGLPYEDLVQEGNLGLIKAVERFDLSKGFKFSTYAHIVISQSIHLAIDKQASLVRMPFKALREKASVEKIRQSIEQALGRVPTINELESALPDDLEYKQVHISNAIEPSASSQSLYASPGDSELLEEMSPLEQDAKTESLSHLDIIDNALARLSDRESYILRMRYGIGLNKEYTLEEISQTVGLSRERVRQLSHNAIDKLSRSFDSSSVK
jgi:RNA polymerase sigma factor (sigma-70 family)